MFFTVNNREKCPLGGVLGRFLGPGVGVSNSFFARGVGNSPLKKLPVGFARGGWSGLELTDTLAEYRSFLRILVKNLTITLQQ